MRGQRSHIPISAHTDLSKDGSVPAVTLYVHLYYSTPKQRTHGSAHNKPVCVMPAGLVMFSQLLIRPIRQQYCLVRSAASDKIRHLLLCNWQSEFGLKAV